METTVIIIVVRIPIRISKSYDFAMPYGSGSQVKSLKQQNPFEIAAKLCDSGHFVWVIFDLVHLGIVFFFWSG